MNTIYTSQRIKQPLSSVNKAIANIGIDVRATEISETLRNMNRMLNRVFFNLKIRRHNRILLTTMMDTDVKLYITCSTTTSVGLADLDTLLLVLFAKSSISFRSIFSNVAKDKPERNTSSFKCSSHKEMKPQRSILRFDKESNWVN